MAQHLVVSPHPGWVPLGPLAVGKQCWALCPLGALCGGPADHRLLSCPALGRNVEEVCRFPEVPARKPLTYQARQLIAREIEVEKMRRAEAAARARASLQVGVQGPRSRALGRTPVPSSPTPLPADGGSFPWI